jgi:hypothetical protein
MSIDPLAAGVADLAALIDAELASLAADAQALRALLVVDAVVTARVLPSNGLTDLLEIAGRRVAASLPPTVRPGDALQVRVTGFDGERILLQIVATGAPAAVETGPANVPLAPDPALFATAPLPPATAPSPSQPASLPPTAPPTPPGLGGSLGAVVSRASVSAPSSDPSAPRGDVPRADPPMRTVVAAGEPTSIEARLVAARATTAPGSASPASPAAPELPAQYVAPAPPPVPAQRYVAPPQIAPKTVQNQNASLAESVGSRLPSAPPIASAAAAASSTYAGKTGLAAYAEPVALLRALRLLVTPSNVASATLALAQPDRLPNALATLERALPRAAAEPHVATLRTLLAFVGRIDPRSPALAAQIAAYVEHVVDGAEPKLATLLAAARASEGPALPGGAPNATANAASANAAAATAQPHSGATTDRPPATPSAAQATRHPAAPAPNADAARTAAHDPRPPIPAAIVAERSAALGADLKQTMLVLASDPATPEALAPALAAAISALTAVQVSAAQTFAANPNGIAFTIPLATQHGPASARISVSRDAPQRGAKLDGENFRIAFVLDTAHFGTVAIDLVTVGRDVTVDVRAESAPAMRAFRDALGRLTERLESLRYRVASAGASVGITSTVGIEAPPAPAVDPNAMVDRSA